MKKQFLFLLSFVLSLNTTIDSGDVTTSNADITLRANEVVLDSGTYNSVGTKLRIENP